MERRADIRITNADAEAVVEPGLTCAKRCGQIEQRRRKTRVILGMEIMASTRTTDAVADRAKTPTLYTIGTRRARRGGRLPGDPRPALPLVTARATGEHHASRTHARQAQLPRLDLHQPRNGRGRGVPTADALLLTRPRHRMGLLSRLLEIGGRVRSVDDHP